MRWQRRRAAAAGLDGPVPRRSLSTLALAFAVLLVAYASLYPFEGWRWPMGVEWVDLMRLPWPRWRDPDDEWLNVLGYVPVGLLLALVALRKGWPLWAALLAGCIGPSLLSFSMELLQTLLPRRVPSLRDWVGNTVGASAGALLALLLQATGLLQRGLRLRDRWFSHDSAVALILLLLWPTALLVPASVPFGLGQCWDEVLEGLLWLIGHVGHAPLTALGLDTDPAGWRLDGVRGPMSLPAEVLAIALGLCAPLALAGAASPPGGHRLGLVPVVAVVGVGGMTLATSLNFGPSHAWSWLTPAATLAVLLAVLMGLLLAILPRRASAALALMVLAAGVALAAQAPTGSYHALNLQAWEQGRFIRFHGLAQWVAWLWPYAAMGWLLVHLGRPR